MMKRLLAGGLVCAAWACLSVHCAAEQSALAGSVRIDGSSTVFPITEAVAEEFAAVAPRLRVTVGVSGTGGGFKRFTVGETDISNASRPIKPQEMQAAASNGVDFIELPIAFDGLSIVVNRQNDFVDSLTLDEVRRIFLDGGAERWNEVRPNWPDRPIRVYSPGTDSGTFDYFKEVVAGDDGSIRADMSVSEDDNVLVRGVAGDENAIGFFGFAYFAENESKLRAVAIDAGEGAVAPSVESIESGEYAPFSRPLFVYVNKEAASRPEVKAFVDFYLENAPELAVEVGYVRLPADLQARVQARWTSLRGGTAFIDAAGHKVTGSLRSVYN